MWKLALFILLVLLTSVTILIRRHVVQQRADGAGSRSPIPPGATDSSGLLTASEPIVPGKLTVEVYVHSLESSDGTIRCWTYVSSGLWPLGQQEIAFTVKRRPGDADGAYHLGRSESTVRCEHQLFRAKLFVGVLAQGCYEH